MTSKISRIHRTSGYDNLTDEQKWADRFLTDAQGYVCDNRSYDESGSASEFLMTFNILAHARAQVTNYVENGPFD